MTYLWNMSGLVLVLTQPIDDGKNLIIASGSGGVSEPKYSS